jgi:alpha-ribazole phosphatase
MALILMRHPKPAIAAGVCYGVSDLDLAEPIDLACHAALPAFARLVSSPLQRCRLLGQAIGAVHGVSPVIDPRLREMDFGAWEGVPWDDIPRAQLQEWADDFEHARPHGGESVAMLAQRVDAALADYRAQSGDCLIITHAGVIKAATRNWRLEVDFGACVHV